jgi:beta-phosphoglucomutase
MDKQLQAILFDLDGVIVSTDHYHFLAWQKLARENDWKFDQEINHQLRGVPRLTSLEIILRHNKLSISDSQKEQLASTKNRYYQEFIDKITPEDQIPGAISFVKELKEHGLKLAVCSSSKNSGLVLDKLGIKELFDVVITGNEIKKAKPEPEIFLTAMEKLNVQPENTLVFEDAESGIKAALAANLKVIAIGKPENLPGASFYLENFLEVDYKFISELKF